MGRKKKKDKSDREYIPASLSYPAIDGSYMHHLNTSSPYTITTTTSSGRGSCYVYPSSIYSDPTTSSVTIDSSIYKAHDWRPADLIGKLEREAIGNVNIKSERLFQNQYLVTCDNIDDLSVERILKTLSAIKGKLMIDVSPIRIQKIECSMTPAIRRNIILASKKLKMYGKKQPIVARFDDYGNRLPDRIDLDMSSGVTLKIIDPEDYGMYYLGLKATVFPDADYITRQDFYGFDVDDVPF